MKLIACVDMNWGIGYEGNLLYHIKDDLDNFKKLTTGGIVIMGKRTLDSLPGGKPLPNRINIVLTSQDLDSGYDNLIYMHSKEEVLEYCNGKDNCYCIGGESVYSLFINECDAFYITYVLDASKEADTYLFNFEEDGPDYCETNHCDLIKVSGKNKYDEENKVFYRYDVYMKTGNFDA